MKFTFRIVLIVAVVILLTVLGVTLLYGYRSTMLYMISSIGERNRTEQILALVSEMKFIILQIMCLIIAVLFFILLLTLDKVVAFFHSVFLFVKSNVSDLVVAWRKTNVKWILIIPFISSVFFAVYMPVSYDEAWTYLQFTSKSPLSSLCYYPAPNNHVLHSLITNVTRYTPFLSTLLCLRISSILFSFFSWLICFSFLKKYYSENISLVITGFASMLFMSVYYSYMSRGYGLVLFFFIIGLYAAFNIISKDNRAKDWIVFAVTNVLGFFTMPSYLYAFLSLNIFILLNNKFQLRDQFVYNLCTLIFVLVLYTPIIIVNGVGALTSNTFVVPISRMEVIDRLPGFLATTLTEISGVSFLCISVLLMISFLKIIQSKNKFELTLFVIFIASPALFLIVHSVIPFPRTFYYYAFVLVFLVVIPFKRNIQNISAMYLLIVVVTIQFLLVVNFYLNIKKYETFNITYHEMNKNIVGNKSYFFSTVLFETNFLFENEIQGYTMTKSEFNFPQVNVDADTIKGFDYYIIDKKYDFTRNKRPAYSDSRTNVYTK